MQNNIYYIRSWSAVVFNRLLLLAEHLLVFQLTMHSDVGYHSSKGKCRSLSVTNGTWFVCHLSTETHQENDYKNRR